MPPSVQGPPSGAGEGEHTNSRGRRTDFNPYGRYGIARNLDLIAVMTAMAGASSPVVGWIGHCVIGALFWDVGLVIVSPYRPTHCGSAVQFSPRALPRGRS
jgi:hypothetical protein